MKRIFLFVVTNLAVLALLSVVLFIVERVFGVQLRNMSRTHAEAVLGHEITHVARGDMVTLARSFAPIGAVALQTSAG